MAAPSFAVAITMTLVGVLASIGFSQARVFPQIESSSSPTLTLASPSQFESSPSPSQSLTLTLDPPPLKSDLVAGNLVSSSPKNSTTTFIVDDDVFWPRMMLRKYLAFRRHRIREARRQVEQMEQEYKLRDVWHLYLLLLIVTMVCTAAAFHWATKNY